MAKKNINYYLVKTARISGWLLLPLMIVYIITGFALCGKWGFSRLLDQNMALLIHQIFDWPLVVIFLVHASVTGYLSMRRWGWIKKPTRN